jgi:hypothetical protein
MCSDTANPENGELIVIVQVPTKILLPAKEQKNKKKKGDILPRVLIWIIVFESETTGCFILLSHWIFYAMHSK